MTIPLETMNSRKELQAQYHQMQPKMGVFQIKNLVTNRHWIEGSLNMDARWNRHRMELRLGSHRNKKLQHDWSNHGEEHFEFTVLAELAYNDKRDTDYKAEAKILLDIVLEELNLSKELLYQSI